MQLELKSKVHNRFDFEVIDKRTGEIRQRAQAENVILNMAWQAMNEDEYMTHFCFFPSYIAIGTGTGTLAPTRTDLFAPLGNLDFSVIENYSNPQPYGPSYTKRLSTILTEEYVGSVITEVGLRGPSYEGSRLLTHALLKDSEGNPISITKTEYDEIKIYSTFYFQHVEVEGIHLCGYSVDQGASNADPVRGKMLYTFTGYTTSVFHKMSVSKHPQSPIMGGSLYGQKFTTNNVNLNASLRNGLWGPSRLRLASSDQINGSKIRQIGVGMGESDGDSFRFAFWIKCWENIYSGTVFTAETIGTGDGSNVEFNTAWDEVIKSLTKVYVNSVEQTQGVDYALNRFKRNFNWISEGCFERATMPDFSLTDFSEWSLMQSLLRLSSSNVRVYPAVTQPQMDFVFADDDLEDMRIGQFTMKNYTTSSSIRHAGAVQLLASDDGVNYTEIASGSGYTGGTVIVLNFTPCSHKYFRLVVTQLAGAHTYDDFLFLPQTFGFIQSGGMIVFGTPPSTGAVVTADYKVPYLAKDVNHIVDLQPQWTMSEAT